MATLPVPGASKNSWGSQLNEFLREAHNEDGTLKDVATETDFIALSETVDQVGALVQEKADSSQVDVSLNPDGTLKGDQVEAGLVDAGLAVVTDGEWASVFPGGPGTIGQSVRYRGGEPVLDDPLTVDLRDDGVKTATVDNVAGINAGLARAGFNAGLGPGSTKFYPQVITLPRGDLRIASPIEANNSMFFRIGGVGQPTNLRPTADMSAMIALNSVSYGEVCNFMVHNPSSNWVVDDVITLDWLSGTGNGSAQNVNFHHIHIADVDYKRGISIGRNSSNRDVSHIAINNCQIDGSWTSGEATKWQAGIYFGSGTQANVLNHTVSQTKINGARYGVVVNATNVSLRDVWMNGGGTGCEASANVIAHGNFVWDGGRIEGYDKLLFADGGDSATRSITIRNMIAAMNINTTNVGIHVNRCGNIILENILWDNPNYVSGTPSTHKQILTGGNKGRRITLRNFSSRESLEQLWWYTPGSGFDRKLTHITLDGFVQMGPTYEILSVHTGLYTRTITNATDWERKHVLPYDGRLIVDTSGGAIAPELPFAKWMGGRELYITQSGANACTITAQSGETVAGSGTLVPGNGNTVHLISDGVNWVEM